MGEHNPFLDYLERHPNADLEALKQLFRILAKRTHPDLGAENHDSFVALQESYHLAVARVLEGSRDHAGPLPGRVPGEGRTRSPREETLHHLYRYKAHLPAMALEGPRPSELCLEAFARAMASADRYDLAVRDALNQYHRQFHLRRSTNSGYPDVRTKYLVFMRGLTSAFDYLTMPTDFNLRVARSYLEGIKPVTDFDPTKPPELRTNRSAPARAALYKMKVMIGHEIDLGTCGFL